MERKSITNYSSITAIPSSITTCVPSPHTTHAGTQSTSRPKPLLEPLSLPSFPAARQAHDAQIQSVTRRRRSPIQGEGDARWTGSATSGRVCVLCGQRPYTHTKRTQGERLFPVSLLLWLLFAFAKIWSHVLLGWWFSNYDLLIDKIFLKWMPRIGRTSMFLYSSCFCK